MAEKNNFDTTMESLFKGMENFITSKTVVGDAINIDGTIILPLIDVSFGVGAGSSNQDKKNSGMGGMAGKMSPSAVLVIKNGSVRVVNIKNQDVVNKLVDMVPDIIDRFTSKADMPSDEEAINMAFPEDKN